ncbi:MAG: ATP-binding cassette domain-containing protein [Rickettsiaceae bacterium]|nr:ATP-binding cassette domain-containing protein [Rickettsiaceae bacterium]
MASNKNGQISNVFTSDSNVMKFMGFTGNTSLGLFNGGFAPRFNTDLINYVAKTVIGENSNLLGHTSISSSISSAALSGAVVALDEALLLNRATKQYWAKHYLSNTILWGNVLFPIVEIANHFIPQNYHIASYMAATAGSAISAYYSNDTYNYHEKIKQTIDNPTPFFRMIDDGKVFSEDEITRIEDTAKDSTIGAAAILSYDLIKLFTTNKSARSMVEIVGIDILSDQLKTYWLKSGSDYLLPMILGKKLGQIEYTLDVSTIIQKITNVQTNTKLTKLESEKKVEAIIYGGVYQLGLGIILASLNKAVDTLADWIKEPIYDRFNNEIVEKYTDLILDSNNMSKIFRLDGSEELRGSLLENISEVYSDAISKLTSFTSTKFIGASNYHYLVNNAPGLILLSHLEYPRKELVKAVTTDSYQLNKQINRENQKLEKIYYDTLYHLDQIALTDYADIVKTNMQDGMNSVNKLNKTIDRDQKNKALINGFSDAITSLLGDIYLLFASRDLTMAAKYLAESHSIKAKGYGAYKFMQGKDTSSWDAKRQIAVDNLNQILDAIESKSVFGATIEYNKSNKLEIKNYELNLSGAKQFHIKHLSLDAPGCYAIMGQSGIGKTSMLKDIAGCLQSPLSSSGNVSLPLNKDGGFEKPIVLDQHFFLPANSTLFEVITKKTMDSMNHQQLRATLNKIAKLMLALKIDSFAEKYTDSMEEYKKQPDGIFGSLEDKKYDISSLSGGQRKKLALIKAIMSGAKIIFADEIFAGLDTESIKTTQKLIKEYLPDSLVVIIDHYAINNNLDKFYDGAFHILKGTNIRTIDLDQSSQNHLVYKHVDPADCDLPEVFEYYPEESFMQEHDDYVVKTLGDGHIIYPA